MSLSAPGQGVGALSHADCYPAALGAGPTSAPSRLGPSPCMAADSRPPMSLDAQDKIGKHEVDARMVRALADLPERLGEEACTRFDQSVDSGVRSRQGFMVGFEGGICRG